jgi:hypothetical protein
MTTLSSISRFDNNHALRLTNLHVILHPNCVEGQLWITPIFFPSILN